MLEEQRWLHDVATWNRLCPLPAAVGTFQNESFQTVVLQDRWYGMSDPNVIGTIAVFDSDNYMLILFIFC